MTTAVQMFSGLSNLKLAGFAETLSNLDIVIRVLAATAMGAFVGLDREIKNRPAGMRTHVLVCVGAMLIALIEQQTIAHVFALSSGSINVSAGRITSSVVSGIGFLGAGTIVMSDRKVTGLTTAASLWCTACIGLAVGYGYYLMALVAGVSVVLVLTLLHGTVHIHTLKRLEVQFVHRQETQEYLENFFNNMKVKVLDVDFHAENRESGRIYTNYYTLSMPGQLEYVDIIETLSKYKNIQKVGTKNL